MRRQPSCWRPCSALRRRDESRHERARRHDALASPARIVEREADEVGAEAAVAKLRLDLGVDEVDDALRAAVVEHAGEPAVDAELVAARSRVVRDLAQQPGAMTSRFAMPFGRGPA